jgi:hypothetical protein
MKILLDVAHHPQRELGREDAGVLRLILLQDVGLHRAADLVFSVRSRTAAHSRRRARALLRLGARSTC